MFENFYGNSTAAEVLNQMVSGSRIPQTILLAGPDGIGKATLARRFGARLLGHGPAIEKDDLSLLHNVDMLAEREKMPADKRGDDPLLFQSHPDFVTFCPEGPLRQISIQQMRILKERAQFAPLKGRHRIFLIDQIDRANEQAKPAESRSDPQHAKLNQQPHRCQRGHDHRREPKRGISAGRIDHRFGGVPRHGYPERAERQ